MNQIRILVVSTRRHDVGFTHSYEPDPLPIHYDYRSPFIITNGVFLDRQFCLDKKVFRENNNNILEFLTKTTGLDVSMYFYYPDHLDKLDGIVSNFDYFHCIIVTPEGNNKYTLYNWVMSHRSAYPIYLGSYRDVFRSATKMMESNSSVMPIFVPPPVSDPTFNMQIPLDVIMGFSEIQLSNEFTVPFNTDNFHDLYRDIREDRYRQNKQYIKELSDDNSKLSAEIRSLRSQLKSYINSEDVNNQIAIKDKEIARLKRYEELVNTIRNID